MRDILFFLFIIIAFVLFIKANRVEKVYHTCDWSVEYFGGSLDGNDLWGTKCKHGYTGGYWCYSCGDIKGDTIRNIKDLIEIK